MSDIPTKYYRKELFSTPLFLSRGVQAPFEPVGNDEGMLATADSSLIFSLANAISRRIGGVYEITEEEYEELKKKETPTKKLSPRWQPLRTAPPQKINLSGQPTSPVHQPKPKEPAPPAAEPEKSPTPSPAIERGKAAKTVKKGKAPDVSDAPPPAP